MRLSVIIPTRNPHPHRFARTLAGLAAQTLNSSEWELLIVDNGSDPALQLPIDSPCRDNLRIVHEPVAGLTPARLRGIRESGGEVLVFVDDDNVLAAGFLAAVLERFSTSPNLAVAGGPVRPEFEIQPPTWVHEFRDLLALHDHGDVPLVTAGGAGLPWPAFSPVGAGLCIRRSHAIAYADSLALQPERRSLDRRGGELTSGGDNDMVFTAFHAGGDVGYFPELALVHLIPAGRINAGYLARLNQGIQRSWVRVLDLHGQNPWRPIPGWSVPLRSARAWLRTQAWRSPSRYIRWRGLHGRFLGQSDLTPPSLK
ncbi:MAG TPA: glycosyltransferase [Rariglobus sp.]|jgi:glycosyltransferase involved in cell wall biosynthesis|nr:glycosyltransferase [Rariglobus sp.]